MEQELHPFGDFVCPDSAILIIGSFPCFNGVDYGDWFYSGSGKNDFWKLLSEIYNSPVNGTEQKKELSIKNKIAITDIALTIERINSNCKDSNLRIIEYNKAGIEKCLEAGIIKILFTSKFVEAQFKKLFPFNQIPSLVLISPSPSANRYIARLDEYKRLKQNNEITSTYEYRLAYYTRLLKP
jgi:G:T/U-mismatch repair DNA glycosylase